MKGYESPCLSVGALQQEIDWFEEKVERLKDENAKLKAQLTEVLEIQTVEKFQEIIRTQCDEISALKDQLRWRPVSEKPEEHVEVLVRNKLRINGVFSTLFIVAVWDGEGWITEEDEDEVLGKVTHWLPIPPTPQGE